MSPDQNTHATDTGALERTGSHKILVVGEALVDIVTSDGKTSEHVGGSPANVALAMARLGHTTMLVTDVGDDPRGRRITEHLADSGVEVLRGHAPHTSSARATLSPRGAAEYTFDLSWDPPAIDLDGASHVHTGSIALYLEPGSSAVLDMLETRPAGVTASVDANIRPAIVGSHPVGIAHFERAARACEIIKLSDEDAMWLYPGWTCGEVLTHLLRLGAQLAVVTRGEHGLELASPIARASVAAQPTSIADTIGAGDSAMAAILDAAVRERQEAATPMPLDVAALRKIGQWAARVASITASRAGANPPTLREVLARPIGGA